MLSIEETKEILGEEYENCSNDEIEKIRDSAYFFADIFLEGIVDVCGVPIDVNNDKK